MAATRILVVDDDSLLRMDLCEVLQRLGYIIAGEAGDAMSAVHMTRNIRPDLVMMDIRMPGEMDGIDAAVALAGEGIAPVLLLTAFSDQALIKRATEAAVVGYLLKPFSEEALLPAIEVTLARFREFQAIKEERTSLREQIETRKLIERAKGVLMAQLRLTEAEAFSRIQRTSMNSRQSMRAIAEAILLNSQISPDMSAPVAP